MRPVSSSDLTRDRLGAVFLAATVLLFLFSAAMPVARGNVVTTPFADELDRIGTSPARGYRGDDFFYLRILYEMRKGSGYYDALEEALDDYGAGKARLWPSYLA